MTAAPVSGAVSAGTIAAWLGWTTMYFMPQTGMGPEPHWKVSGGGVQKLQGRAGRGQVEGAQALGVQSL